VSDVVFEFANKRLQHCGFSRSDFTGYDHKAIGQPDRRFHVRLGTGVLFAPVDKLRIRCQPERLLIEIEVL
jgi:hypothetical protein